MHADCEFCVKRNICTRDVPKPCRYRYTEDERKADQASDQCGVILSAMYLPKTYQKEDKKMEPTSVWKIENVDNICITQDVDGMSMMLKNKDDLTEIMLSGEAIDNYNDKFVIALKADEDAKDQKIKELENKLHQVEKDKDRLTDRYKSLDDEYTKFYEKWVRMLSEQDSHKNTRSDILDQAKKCVCGQREQDYGTPESNFKIIADLWNDYLGLSENGDGVPIFSIKNITPTDVAMMMALLKIARIRNGGGSGDSFVDLAGYAACGGEIWADKRNLKDQN